jgi:hypothetical protein
MQEIVPLQEDLRYYSSMASVDAPVHSAASGGVASRVDGIIGFCRAIGLCLTRTLILTIKCIGHNSDRSALSPEEVDSLYRQFHGQGFFAGIRPLSVDDFRELAGIILDRRLHLLPAGSPETIEFAYSREGSKSILPGESGADAERYWTLHAAWRELEEEVATLLLRLEKQTLKNEKINQRWMEAFGHLYIPLLELEGIFREISAMVEKVIASPELSAEEMAKLERDLQSIHAEAGRDRKREPAKRSYEECGAGPGGIPWSEAEEDAYEEECKTLLRKIWQLTHPDMIGREGFTDQQKRRLAESYQEAMAWKEKSKLEESEIGLTRRSTTALRIILDRVERIWEEMGFDGDGVARVRGNSPEERLAWLEARIAVLDEEIKEIKADILAVSGDRDSREKEACMVTGERIAAVLSHMEERTAWYRDQIADRGAELARLLDVARKGGNHA